MNAARYFVALGIYQAEKGEHRGQRERQRRVIWPPEGPRSEALARFLKISLLKGGGAEGCG